MNVKWRTLFLTVLCLGALSCNDDEKDIPEAIIGTWDGEVWNLVQQFDGGGLNNNQFGTFDGTLILEDDQSFSFQESTNIVDNIFETFEMPTEGTYEAFGIDQTFGSIIFNAGADDETFMEIFKTDTSITLTYREQVRLNGGLNDIEVSLFFVEE